jgi:hypothetical protein
MRYLSNAKSFFFGRYQRKEGRRGKVARRRRGGVGLFAFFFFCPYDSGD